MKFENTEVFNFKGALRGMRNPLESWEKSDSIFQDNQVILGPKDLDLCKRLINGGAEHRKFLRQIFVSVDITAPLFVWKEISTYKISTTANSTSTMHKLSSKPITIENFETDDYCKDLDLLGVKMEEYADNIIGICEVLRRKYLETKDVRYWKELVRWLPEGWLQTRTWTANYEVLRNIYHQRKNHKLSEWHSFCAWIEELPYAKELIIGEDNE